MDNSKYGKYIITEPKAGLTLPSYRVDPKKDSRESVVKRLLFLDKEVVEGAFYCEVFWYMHATEEPRTLAHTHDYDEVAAYIGSNPDDPRDLGGEIEFWLEDEKHMLTKSSLIFIPKGMVHSPTYIRRVDRPIFHFTTGQGKMYT
jgi:hypothetical protein